MGSNLISSALSGLNAAQYGITTTENNISNASTPGYSRQQVLLSPLPGQSSGSGFVGQGVDVTGVRRVYDQYLTTQVLQQQSQASYLTTFQTAIAQVDNLLSNQAAGIPPALQNFFNGLNALANNPADIPTRQALLGDAQTVVGQFQSVNQQLTSIANGLNGQISGSVQSINSYAQQIAALNRTIKQAVASGQGQQPNALLDQRDQLINQLGQQIQTTALQQSDGTISVFIGTGQALVMGNQAMSLQATTSASNPRQLSISYLGPNGGGAIPLPQGSLQGGSLGAYLNFQEQSLTPAQNALGLAAIGLATSVNQQNQMGQDLKGALGGAIFNVAVPKVVSNAGNTGTALVSATISNVGALTTSDYQLKFDGTNYAITNLSNNAVTNLGTTLPQTIDGFTVNLNSGTAAAGDSFLIQPTVNGANAIGLVTNDPAKLAAAAPILAAAGSNNAGSATIGSGTVLPPPPTSPNLLLPLTITFNNPPTTYSLTSTNATIGGGGTTVSGVDTTNIAVGMPVTGGGFPAGTTIASITNGTTFVTSAGGTVGAGQTLQVGNFPYISGGVSLSNATISGSTVTVSSTTNLTVGAPMSGGGFPAGTTVASITNGTTFVTSAPAVPAAATGQTIQVGNTFNGWVAQISGTPVAGDTFTVGPNTNAVGDNRNALLMAGLQTQTLMSNGTASIGDIYSQLVAKVGSTDQQMTASSAAQNNMLSQTVASQQAISGVNLNEEAANLVQFQNAYQASAKALQIANSLFTTLLSSFP